MMDPREAALEATIALRERGVLPIWTVYDHPKDFPDVFVARLFDQNADGPLATVTAMGSSNLRELRQFFIDYGLVRIPRYNDDDPCIIECWV
jgi:hypothetical protein